MAIRVVLLACYIALVMLGAGQIEGRRVPPAFGATSPKLIQRFLETPVVVVRALRTTPDAAYRAAIILESGHRLRADDLVQPPGLAPDLALHLPAKSDLVGKYLTKAVPRNGEVRAADMSELPDSALAARAGATLRIWLGEEHKKLADVLDVGWTVDVCDENTCPVKGGAVVAIECRSVTECAVVLNVKPLERRAYLDLSRKDKAAIIVSEPKSGG